jgi:hypothetical protein
MESIVAPNWVKEPNDIRVNAGDDVGVECIADGLPKPTIKWISSKGLKFFFENFFVNKTFKLVMI